MKKFLTTITTVLVAVLLVSSHIGISFAESNFAGMPDSLKNLVKDNYWAEVEYKSNNAVPKYLMTPEESSLNGINFSASDGSDYPTTGIRTDRLSLFPFGPRERNGDGTIMWIQNYSILSGDPSLAENEVSINMDVVRAFGFDFKKSFMDTNDMYIYGDILVNGNTQHDKVAILEKNKSVDLKFVLDMSKMKKYLNTFLMIQSGSNNHSDPQTSWNTPSNSAWKKDHADSDAELVFVMDLPRGVKVDGTTGYSIDGLTGFTIRPEVRDQRLIVHVRKTPGSTDKSLKKLYKIINELDKISLNISNVKITNEVPVDENLKIVGYAYGAYDLASGTNLELIKTRDMTKKRADDIIYRNYVMFAAKQNEPGRDSTAPADKPNLISYTFKVNKAPDNPGGGGGGGTTPDPGRVDGDDRVETGIKISQKYYDKAKTVIVVRHDLFPDSMTASVLAKLKDAPILLNPTNKLDPRVGAEIKRLGAEEVIIVGGPDSISEKVRGDLKAYDKDKDVERIAGVDRYGTSEMVARRVTGITGKKNTGVIASGQVFPDALSVGTFASRDGYPILLVKKNLVPDQVVRAIKDLDIKKTYIAGGTNTISKSTEAKLPGVLERMAGKDRYETSVAIAKSKFRDSKEAFIASGEEFADALVISPVSGKYNRPTLLASRNKKTNAVVKKYIEESYLTSITAIGGEKYLPKSVILDLVGK